MFQRQRRVHFRQGPPSHRTITGDTFIHSTAPAAVRVRTSRQPTAVYTSRRGRPAVISSVRRKKPTTAYVHHYVHSPSSLTFTNASSRGTMSNRESGAIVGWVLGGLFAAITVALALFIWPAAIITGALALTSFITAAVLTAKESKASAAHNAGPSKESGSIKPKNNASGNVFSKTAAYTPGADTLKTAAPSREEEEVASNASRHSRTSSLSK